MNAHTGWCAGGHRCTLGEHRAHPITLHVPGAGSLVVTRVRQASGTEHAEVRLSVVLADSEPAARHQLTALITHLTTVIGPSRPLPAPPRRAA
jgi:hypothetical protein